MQASSLAFLVGMLFMLDHLGLKSGAAIVPQTADNKTLNSETGSINLENLSTDLKGNNHEMAINKTTNSDKDDFSGENFVEDSFDMDRAPKDTIMQFTPCCGFNDMNKVFSCCACNPLLTEIPTNIPTNTEMIELCGNLIEEIPENGFGRVLSKVSSLILCNNKIWYIDPEVLTLQLPELKILDLHGNNFTNFPEGLPETIENLSLDENPISEINASVLSNLTLLTKFAVSAYTVESDTFASLTSLTNNDDLTLHTCHIKRYAFRGSHLRNGNLFIDYACPEYLDQSQKLVLDSYAFSGFPGENNLRVRYSNIGDIRWRTFTEMDKVNRIDLHMNNISVVEPGAVRDIPNLQYLYIYYSDPSMAINLREGAFEDLPSVTNMYFYGNLNISNIEDYVFNNLPKMIYLELDTNNLETLSPDVVLPVEDQLIRLRLHDNPWRCDCDLRWLWQLIQRNADLIYHTHPRCASPEHLSGREIRSLEESDFNC